ncbi:helix-turn-helix domain-containing protein [Alkalihalobacterium alkalinitrilicum]|uniref:helix-turn-helix domain-containing protein n=1 Tax=Alkalihalobacterium alkalinitrilicum TaxID=427920 RepID=UPI0011518064|nr:helix-turn-helix transcriptional regulator [Alkalihalobacterium alkalinitrilicum]
MFGDRLAKLRTDKKLTQSDFASKLGIPRSTYSNYENGKRQPDFETLQKIADFFEVTTDYLLGRSDKPKFEDKPKEGLAFMGGAEDLTEEEKEYLKETLEVFRRMKARRENKD